MVELDGSYHYAITENGALGYKLDQWIDFLIQITPLTERSEAKSLFEPLYDSSPEEAFR